MTRRHLMYWHWNIGVFIFALLIFCGACSSSAVGGAIYTIGVRPPGTEIEIESIVMDGASTANSSAESASTTVQPSYQVEVSSDNGIGQATLARWGAEAPHLSTIQLNLNGLEHFDLAWGEEIVTVSVRSSDASVAESLRVRDGDEKQIFPDSPYWIEVELPSKSLQSFVLTMPTQFQSDAPRLWEMSWVDFYR